jgi:phosphoenolpyruvate carboxylase
MNRKIPSTMVSQHPDHANKPYWHTEEFIKTQNEALECFLSFQDLGVSEYKWDWEGKFVDESVIERLYGEHFDYFKKNPLGSEKFLTFRLPNPKVETEFRLGRAFMGILGAAGLAKEVGFDSPPLFEVILPMTKSAEEMIAIQTAFKEMASLKHHLYNLKTGTLKHIEIIPLFEQVDVMIASSRILEKYLKIHKLKFGFIPPYMRPYLARSDPALNSGLVPTVLAIKIALSHYSEFEREKGVKLFPIIGSASLPFRGGLTPENVDDFCNEYQGIKTALLQSAFRYDFNKTQVIKGIQRIEKILPDGEAPYIPSKEKRAMIELIPFFETPYRNIVQEIAPLINIIASALPKRRERIQHIGLFGYSRSVGKVSLPRTIGFTAALYSFGIPPELIGTGRGIQHARESGKEALLEKHYKRLKSELKQAGGFLYKEGLEKLARKSDAWKEVMKDVSYIESYLGEKLGPASKEEREHGSIVEKLHEKLSKGQSISEYLQTLAVLRKSLG